MTSYNTNFLELSPANKDKSIKPRIIKRKKTTNTELSNVEENIRIERIREIMKQEQHLANMTSKHEERMTALKEKHLKEYNDLQIKHLKEIHEVEIEIKKAKLRTIDYRVQQKENIDP